MTSTTSITCTACGGANALDDTFCGSCSAFLEWDGAAAQTPAEAGLPVPVPVAAGGAGDAGGADLAPLAALEHRAPQPEAQRPAPRRAAPDGPRDLFCGSCGTGNATGRTFCRSCGQELADVVPEARPGWFARWVRPLWPFGRRRAARGAGERPRSWQRNAARQDRRRGLRWPSKISVGKLAIPLMVLSLFGLGLSPLRARVTTWGFETYDSVRQKVAPELVEVTPAGAVADSAVEGHPAVAAIDQNSSSYWSESREGPGIGATLSVSFATPTDLTQVGITNGATGTAFAQQPRHRPGRHGRRRGQAGHRPARAGRHRGVPHVPPGRHRGELADPDDRGRLPGAGGGGRLGDRALLPHEPVRSR